jgi:hypothetical protein
MHVLTRLLIDDGVVVEPSETSVEDFDGYALTLTTKDPNVTLVLVGTSADLRQVGRSIDGAVVQLDVLAGEE